MRILVAILSFFILVSCNQKTLKKQETKVEKEELFKHQKHKDFNKYWYDGFAEITSYELEQVRYGEIHKGKAVTIFVTEPFLGDKQVKADYKNESNIPVLKLNKTKKFITGIYPYSLMTSTFSPLQKMNNAIKITFSSQEWCGNTFVQLNNRENFEIDFRSYFESNSDKELNLEKNILEDELWNLLRVSPENLPIGNHTIIPSFEYLALNHKEIRAYEAKTSLINSDGESIYKIEYPKLKREVNISYSNTFPYFISKWEEKAFKDADTLITKGTLLKREKIKYWNKNFNKDRGLREKLNL